MTEQNPKAVSLLSKIINAGHQLGASDIHIHSGLPVKVRIDGSVIEMSGKLIFEETQLLSMMKGVVSPDIFNQFIESNQFDSSFSVPNGPRVRINMYRQLNKSAVVMRIINSEIQTRQQLNLPLQIDQVSKLRRGLVVFSGATGSGKSTSMAAIIDEINRTRQSHILTIEDPVEYIYQPDKCVISQREIGSDVVDFKQAFKSALREDPDVILMGEMRDYESINFALELADTGHLVFSTLHAPDAVESISRMISAFPADAQLAMRSKLAQNLKVVVAQRLVKRKPKGRVAVCEVMRVSALVSEMIMDPLKTHEIEELLKGEEAIEGMLHFDEHLRELAEAGVITNEVALENATSRNDLELKLKGF